MHPTSIDTTEGEASQISTTTTTRATISLGDLFHNTLISSHILAYLPPSAIAALLSTDRALRDTLVNTPGLYRHLDLTTVKVVDQEYLRASHHHYYTCPTSTSTQIAGDFWDDFRKAAPLRQLFATLQSHNFLSHVQTLVLDGLSVTSHLCYHIINDDRLNVRLLSIRNVRDLDHVKLRAALQHACRPDRDRRNSPRLRGVYLFGPPDSTGIVSHTTTSPSPITASEKSKSRTNADAWWEIKGKQQLKQLVSEDWARCLLACQGLIAFDALLCQGPRHRSASVRGGNTAAADATAYLGTHHSPVALATYSLSGCDGCGTAPEGLTTLTTHSPAQLPLLAPPPIMSSSLRAATTPAIPTTGNGTSGFVARCIDCIRERYCHCCNKWWCESCYQLPGQAGPQQQQLEPAVVILDDNDQTNLLGSGDGNVVDFEEVTPKAKSRVSKSCWECGNNCESCIDRTQRVCKKCCAGYCIIHNEGSSAEFCDWCVSRGRRMAKAQEGSSSPPITVTRDLRHLQRIRGRAEF